MFCFPTAEKNYEALTNDNGSNSSAGDDGATMKKPEEQGFVPTTSAVSRRGIRSRDRDDGAGEPGTALCPTCDGHGKVPKEQERNLLAVIPADDDRLKVKNSFVSVWTDM